MKKNSNKVIMHEQTSHYRDDYFDILKGFAIISVVIGHSIQYINVDGWQDMLAEKIYMYHLPLFVFISVYFFFPSASKSNIVEYFTKKFISVFLPSLSFGLFFFH